MIRTFELDDVPHLFVECLSVLDLLRSRFPRFRANLFCVTGWMSGSHKAEIQSRPWLRMYPHGFQHKKGECRKGDVSRWENCLDELATDSRWGKVFKAPWHGYSEDFLRMLDKRGFASASTFYAGWPLPMPGEWRTWNLCRHQHGAAKHSHIEAHPPDNKHGPLTLENALKWSASWSQEDEFAFVEDLVASPLTKLHLGCGEHVWPGWLNLDARPELDKRIVGWRLEEMLPLPPNQADIAFTSHLLNYAEEDKYAEFLLDVWRVLRPGGVLRMSEDETDSGYVWRRPGQGARGTGVIKSLPTKAKVVTALERVGFEVHDASPLSTLSPHVDVLQGNSRARRYARGEKFYVEAVKRCDYNVSKVRSDPRATRRGRWQLAELE